MSIKPSKLIETAELVLPCLDLDQILDFFTEKLGFLLIAIFPADNPSVAIISGYGLRIRLEKEAENFTSDEKIRIRLYCTNPSEIYDGAVSFTSPNGVQIELVESNPSLKIPALKSSFVLNKYSNDSEWIKGRAGMRYRNLIPDRQGGCFIASHINIPKGGLVPDYVHFHKVRFQMIYCYKGWVKVVYEDQGKPFILAAGDCVLQPPEIRHRVLESSDNLEVIEIGCPAEHETFADHEMILPTPTLDSNREFNKQTFVRHMESEAEWKVGELMDLNVVTLELVRLQKGWQVPRSSDQKLPSLQNCSNMMLNLFSFLF